MQIVDPKSRSRPFQSSRTHARLRHDYATWHEDHLQEVVRSKSPRLPFANKSKFDSPTIIEDAIGRSYEHQAQVASNGNHVVTFDMGYQVGFDAATNSRTSAVTVILSPLGEVITAHPGKPRSKDQHET